MMNGGQIKFIFTSLFYFSSKYLQFCGVGLHNAQLYERSQLEVRRNQVLLDLAGVIFQEQSTIDNMIDRILTHMLSLIRYFPKQYLSMEKCVMQDLRKCACVNADTLV